MNKKQTIGVVIAAAAILITGIAGVVSNIMEDKIMSKQTSDTVSSFELLLSDMESSVDLPDEDFVGIINIVGEIGPSEEENIWSTTTSSYDHNLNIELVEAMMESDSNKGILLYVDSPGGTVYESDDLYLKLMQYKNETGRPIWAYFASQACSGGYYISMAADEIYANRNCTTGSIGVIISATNLNGLYDKLGIEIVNITSGENKAMEFEPEQIAIYQSIVDEAYDQFVEIVCNGRNLDNATVRKLADGRVYTAKQALDNKLVDGVCTYEEFIATLENAWELDKDVVYHDAQNESDDLFGGLFATISTLIPKSEAEIGLEIMNSKRSGVPMYYAQ